MSYLRPAPAMAARCIVLANFARSNLTSPLHNCESVNIALDRSTLSNWVGTVCWCLASICDQRVTTTLSSSKIFAKNTSLPELDPGRG
jgi:hypothetical protein